MLGIYASLIVGDIIKDYLKKFQSVLVREKNSLIDVSQMFLGIMPESIDDLLRVESDYFDIKLKYSDNGFKYKVMLDENVDKKKLNIECESTEKKIKIIASCEARRIKGYLEINLPYINNLEIETIGADVDINCIKSKLVSIKTRTGDINIHMARTENASILTREGDILLEIPDKVYKLNLKTEDGEIVKKSSKKSYQSLKNISCVSKYGDITVI